MANSLGALVVTLGLDNSEFTRGLTKAEVQARQFAQNVRTTLLEVGKVLGTLEIGRQFIENTKQIIAEASALNDLADATGSSVESLSRLNNQAKIAGADFATLQNAVLKLSQGMAGADEDANKTKEALRILGITTKDPVEALQQAALKLNGFADGVNKVGFAVALFGKQGAGFLATLKDIADLQDVGATVTAKQAAEAENLEKAFRRLSVEATGFKNAVLSDVVPALTRMIEEFREGIKISGGFFAALRIGGGINPLKDDVENLRALSAELEDFKKKQAEGKIGLADVLDVADIEKRITLLRSRVARAQRDDPTLRAIEDRGFVPEKPPAPNPPSDRAKTLKDQTTEAEKYLESLKRQYQATLDLNAVDSAQVAIFQLKQKAAAGLTPELEKQINQFARWIDEQKESKRVAEEDRKAQEEAAKARERYLEANRRAVETAEREVQAIKDSSEQIREQILFLTQGQTALDDYMAAKREKIALEKEDTAATLAAIGEVDLAQKYRDAAAALREVNQATANLRIAENIKKEAEAVQSLKGAIFDVVGTSISDLIVNGAKASDVLKQLEKNLLSFLTNQALLGLKNYATGAPQGGDFFSIIAGLLGAGGSGLGYGTIGSSIPIGPFPYAAGTSYARGGLSLVGEGGPELVNLPAGARVTPANYGSARSAGNTVINQYINVQPGANTASAKQAAARLRDVVASSSRDR